MVVVLKRISQRHIRLIFEGARGSGGERGPTTRDDLLVSFEGVYWCIVWCIPPLQRYGGEPNPP